MTDPLAGVPASDILPTFEAMVRRLRTCAFVNGVESPGFDPSEAQQLEAAIIAAFAARGVHPEGTPTSETAGASSVPSDAEILRAYRKLFHELIHPDNGYCNQCGGHWLYDTKGNWHYNDGEHTPDCVARKVIEREYAEFRERSERPQAVSRGPHACPDRRRTG